MKITNLLNIRETGMKKLQPDKPYIAVGMGTCGIGNGADEVYRAFAEILAKNKPDIILKKAGCFGFCAEEPLVNLYRPGKPLLILNRVLPQDAEKIMKNITTANPAPLKPLCKIEEWDHLTGTVIHYGKGLTEVPEWNKLPFYNGQKKVVLRNCGLINPEDIEEYIAVGGYHALVKVLQGYSPEKIIAELKTAKLRGRGGAGFPTWRKWDFLRQAKTDEKYIICNADEGDPGAYMNRNEMESDPHMLLEGMLIGAYTMGANEGVIYVRAEYPLAVKRLKTAIRQAKDYGLLGDNILNSGFNFQIHIVEGAGAFVCGEETALIESIEGKAGRPRPRPPFPAEKGFRGKPTNINNVETWCNIPVIVLKGGSWFAETGTENSAGTKVFSLVGKVKNTGLVELPLGTRLETIVYQIGEGNSGDRKIKAIQIGGPSGGCIPKELFATPVDYESLTALGAIMGSGGMVVMDEDNCMVDIAKYFTEFTSAESCGKCVPCREGLYQSLKILQATTRGESDERDLAELELLGKVIKNTALCGLGQTGPNPVITTLKYFRNEYEEHILEKRCLAGICESLFLSPCENSCPLHINIPGYLQLLKENRIDDAYELLLRDNPLPATTGRICYHPCENRCRRIDIDTAVGMREVHRYIADTIYQKKNEVPILKRLREEKLPPTGKKVGIVGAGPAGLTAGFYLTRLGHEVTIYESESEAGGMLRYTIPEYRLPKSVLKKEYRLIKDLGVRFLFNTRIGEDKPLDKLVEEYDAVFLATGAHKEISLEIPGEDLKGVLSGTGFLKDIANNRMRKVGKQVLVVGGGNVAIDTARSALRSGARVSIVYRREKEDMPAYREEIKEAELEGVKFVFLAAPRAARGDTNGRVKGLEVTKMKPGGFDSSGRRRPVPTNETFIIPCDTVIVAIGERAEPGFIKDLEVNRFTLQTGNPKVYAGGDLVTGPATAVEAMAAGKRSAESIDFLLTGKHRFSKLFSEFRYQKTAPAEPEGGKRSSMKISPVKVRREDFREVTSGLSQKKACAEAVRCLRCDVKEKE
ncbi:MAG: FAD-dependent oxidoreductase [Candidatus Omnitrophota bacterium]